MKKFLAVSLLFVMLVATFAPVVNAATSATLANELYTVGSKYGMTKEDQRRIEIYLQNNPVTEQQANAVLAKANEAAALMDEAGVTNYDELNPEQKRAMKAIAQEAAAVVELEIIFKGKTAEIYDKNGNLVEVITNNNGKLEYTGNSVNGYVVIPVVAIIALAIAFVAKKKIADAK